MEETKPQGAAVGSSAGKEAVTEQCCETACGKPVAEEVSKTAKTYEEEGHELRRLIKSVAEDARMFLRDSRDTTPPNDDNTDNNHSEMVESAELAYRNLQMAAMWIGKSLQAYHGGTSILDKMSVDEKKNVNKRPLAAQDH